MVWLIVTRSILEISIFACFKQNLIELNGKSRCMLYSCKSFLLQAAIISLFLNKHAEGQNVKNSNQGCIYF